MKIKNIREYRTFYKNEIRDLPNRDEHFMGTFYQNGEEKRTYGWFEIYHGDKEGYGKAEEGIGNFLSSFLDMAKDGQAVYEFLQNAVDAGASHFTMAWGKDEVDGNNYVLIANNGEMFNFDSIRSILNVGSSTKTADSQNIGKFGIGFKLAHRLVGKENGLEELLSDNPSGPILFSWQNGELAQLANNENPELVSIKFQSTGTGKYQITDTNPWLFKILITCFPALPSNGTQMERVRLSSGKMPSSPVFKQEEYQALSRWVKQYRDYLNDDLYKQGALFFIKLGVGKENDLADKNLAEGVRFSLAILQETADEQIKNKHTLQTVQLNREKPIKKPTLNYLFFYITKKEQLSDYLYIRFGTNDQSQLTNEQKSKLERESDIEVLFGFRDYDKMDGYFKGAPNFYLYFPLSEEVHNFNFVLHSNAFYKASSRTFLHKGTVGEDGINERLLRTIAKRIEIELRALYNSDNPSDKEKFLHLYAALLTSKESQNFERQWVKEPFINELTKVLRKLVPERSSFTSNEFTLSHLHPFIKTTSINLPSYVLSGNNVKWFYWGPNAPDIIRYSAIEKLGLKNFDIFQLLLKKDVYQYVNEWIKEERGRIKTIFNELNIFSKEKVQSENFKSNLKNLKLFEFNDGTLLSDNELVKKQDEGYIVLHNKLKDIEAELKKIGIKTSVINLDDYEFYRHYTPYLSPDSQLRSQVKLIEIVSNARPEVLSPDEKLKFFKVLRDMIEEGRRGERLNELRLFKNQRGQLVKIKNILQSTNKLWLQPFIIHVDEKSKELDRYLLSDEELIYERIIYPFWEIIAKSLISKGNELRAQIFDQIKQFYEKSEYFKDSEKQLTEKGGLFFKEDYIEVKQPYYHKNLINLDYSQYKEIQTLIDDKLAIQIPDFDFLSIYSNLPFILNMIDGPLSDDAFSFNYQQTLNFLSFCKACDINVLDTYTLNKTKDNSFDLYRAPSGNYYADNQGIIKYINKYFKESLVLLPEELKPFSDIVPFKEAKLNQKLIDELDINSVEQVIDLIEAFLSEDKHTLVSLFSKIKSLELDLNWENERRNEIIIRSVKRLLSGDKVRNIEFQNKLDFRDNDTVIHLSKIDSANDDVVINYKNNSIKLSRSLILGLEDNGAIRKILNFANKATEKQLITEKEATQLFKIESSTVTNELITNFDKNISDGQLINTHQLAFVLYDSQISKRRLSRYKVLDASNEWQILEGNWILPDISPIEYYNKNKILSKRYDELNSLLCLQDNKVFYYGVDSGLTDNSAEYILPHFLFWKGCSPNILNGKMDNLSVFKHLYDCWQKTPIDIRTPLITDEWEGVLGYKPTHKLYSEYVLSSEKLDDEIIAWIKESEAEHSKLLQTIGVQTHESDIVKLRLWFLENTDSDNPPVMLSYIPSILLSNTLVGVAEGFNGQELQVVPFGENSKKHKIVNEIISRLIVPTENYEVRIPIWQTDNNLCLGIEKDEKPKYLNNEDYENIAGNNNEAWHTLINSFHIIVPNDAFQHFIQKNYEQIVIKYDFIESHNAIEHDEPFYKSWYKKHEIRLFRIPSVDYKVVLINERKSINLGVVSFGDYFKQDGDSKSLYYRDEISFEMLKAALENNEDLKEAKLLQELIFERDKMLKAFYNALTSSGKDDFDNEDSKRLLDSLKEKSIGEKREGIIEEIKSSQKYSYEWFESYIRYLLSFEELADTITQKSISFQFIEPYSLEGKVSEKYFMLKGANSVIPMNIEAFEDFSIIIVFKGGLRENIIVEGVSKKGQDLLTYIPKGINDRVKSNLDQAVSIKINFSPVLDLIQRLYQAFTNEDVITPWKNIKEAIQPLHFIYGPPGTGKTTKICNILENEYQNNPVFKALVLVPTNKAGDVLAKKLILNSTVLSIVRIGSATDPELEALDDEVYKASLDDSIFDATNVIISSIHRFPYYQISKEHGAHYKLFDNEVSWDLVIFDESSMISLPYIVFALLSLKAINTETKYLVAGDPKQIPPIVDTSDKNLENLDMDDESIYKMLNIKSFRKEEQDTVKREDDKIENLTTQYRSVESIGKLFSSFSYNNLLHHGRDLVKTPQKLLPKGFMDDLMNPISLINIPIDIETSVLQPRKLLYSSYHVYAGILTSEIVKYLDNRNDGINEYSVGIISPYKAQAMLMNKLITSSGISSSIQVQCDTVHGFQGDECDIVIFVVNPNNTYYTGHKNSLLSKEYIYNVAMSRAKDYLWILNPFRDIPNNPYISEIRKILGSGASVISSSNIEKILFNNKDFIVKNSYLTGHDNINVFGQVDMKYFIKAGSSAIDIQLRK